MALLTHLQQDAAARLAEQMFFSDAGAETPRPIVVLTEQIGDVQNRIDQQIAQLGISALLLTISATSSKQGQLRPHFDDVSLVVRIQENVLLNRSASGSKQPASLVAEAAAWFLHNWTPPNLGAACVLQRIQLVDHAKLLTYDTVFRLQAGLSEAPVRVSA